MPYNDSYKRWHTPNQSPTAKTKQGYYKVQHPEKYIGDPNLVIFRSSWEHSFCRWCDASPSVLRWSSEPVRIPYYDRVSKLDECKRLGLDPNNPKNWVVKYYNTDFWIEIDKGESITQKMFIEIKPSNQLVKPRPPAGNASLKEQRKFNNAAKTYLINEAKWAAMNAWAEKNNSKFYVFTEKTLSNLLGPHFFGNA
jgi:hypothetical protein